MSTMQTTVRLYQGPSTLGALFTGEPTEGQYVAVVARDTEGWTPYHPTMIKSFDSVTDAIQHAENLDPKRYHGISVRAFANGWGCPADAPSIWKR